MKRAAGVVNKREIGYFSKEMNRQKLNDNDIDTIKDAFYRVMDGLNKLVELMENTDMYSEQKNAQKALKVMKKSELEHLWMNF